MGNKRIKFTKVKPGMVIRGARHYGLVVYVKQPGKLDKFFGDKPYVEMFDAHANYMGRTFSGYNPKEKVQVITGKKRTAIMLDTLREQRKRQMDAERDEKMVHILDELTE